MQLFDSICNSRWFTDTSIILFLNKSDLFREKITRVPLNLCFPDFTGACTAASAAQAARARAGQGFDDGTRRRLASRAHAAAPALPVLRGAQGAAANAGGADYNLAAEYITQRFVELNRTPEKKTVYPHLTCATDTENIRFVWAAVNDIVTRTALRKAGLM